MGVICNNCVGRACFQPRKDAQAHSREVEGAEAVSETFQTRAQEAPWMPPVGGLSHDGRSLRPFARPRAEMACSPSPPLSRAACDAADVHATTLSAPPLLVCLSRYTNMKHLGQARRHTHSSRTLH
eukprot:788234-Pleurochrysis_carterae.AAC.2